MIRALPRAIAKTVAWSFAALVAILAAWFIANRSLDQSVSPQQAALVSQLDQIPDSRNIAVGILGLTAPEGSDFVQHGAKVKALYSANAPHSQIQEMVRGPRALRPTVEY